MSTTLDSTMSSLNIGTGKPKRTSKLRAGSKKSSATPSSTTSADPTARLTIEEPLITAYSQQSRFHRETFDANTTDIDIKGVNISVGQKDILVDAHLRFKAGVKYGMVGQNGVGKSVLMSVLGNNILIGLPQNVRFLHIQQLEEFAPGRTVLQEVLESDVERMRIIREAKLAVPPFELTQKLVNDTMKEVFDAHETVDEKADELRAREILRGLGFKDEELDVDSKGMSGGKAIVRELSGGWRMRVMLAKALFIQPDVLLLDEPSEFLRVLVPVRRQADTQTVVIVSHDRNFLDAVTTETIIFKDKMLTYHPGNYEDWESTTEEQRKRKMRLKEKIVASIQKNIQQAKSTGDDKRLGMVASRKKALDRMGMQRLEDGKRYKRSYHGYRADIEVESGFQTAPITLPTPFEVPFHTNAILQLSEVSFRYPGAKKDIIENVSLDVSPHARIGFLGPNGCGKSTLMNLLAGEAKPTEGEVKKHHRLRIGYFSQHTVDKLDLGLTPLEQLRAWYPEETISQPQALAHFASTVGVSGTYLVTKQKVGTMSGGERNRVALGCVTYCEPHVLLLDEITNHLDMKSVESVVEALREFEGAVVVVSHDMWFLKQVVEGEEEEEEGDDEREGGEKGGVVYIVNGKMGGLRRWESGLDHYVERVRKRAQKEVGS
ncbi:P-loop containing nucleoside triphosphate hydrolase protein [Coprinellus micaceus]|uniref:P-loop containing nucleoside triphosphate hydrolase protein n=1 Tax=Coprinellus micaceus TaxID=71717 RepID=A0A4Y7SCV5_COPMI|nr:P-loop containing nucleoside triphosphate hydrolase protein [Coprinellus micaceus]